MQEVGFKCYIKAIKNSKKLGNDFAEMIHNMLYDRNNKTSELYEDPKWRFAQNFNKTKLLAFRDSMKKLKLHFTYERDLKIIENEMIDEEIKKQIAELKAQEAEENKGKRFGRKEKKADPVIPRDTITVDINTDPIKERPTDMFEIDILKYCLNDWSVIENGRPQTKGWKIEIAKMFLKCLVKKIED